MAMDATGTVTKEVTGAVLKIYLTKCNQQPQSCNDGLLFSRGISFGSVVQP